MFDWVGVMGYPISEPYWATVKIGGQDRAGADPDLPAAGADLQPGQQPATGRSRWAMWAATTPTGGKPGRAAADRWPRRHPPAAHPPGNPTPGGGGAAIHDWFSKADLAMNALTAMKGRSCQPQRAERPAGGDFADYAYEAPNKFDIKVAARRAPACRPTPSAEQMRVGNQFYQRINNARAVGRGDHQRHLSLARLQLHLPGRPRRRGDPGGTDTVDGTPCQIVRTADQEQQGRAGPHDRHLRRHDRLYHPPRSDRMPRQQRSSGGPSTTDFYDFNVPNNLDRPDECEV